ncbi:integral membrane protein S linking to the trans Golgi network-domain-containing protein [Protomyces lactucae-debilis]|uniref:Integral membrane protein S linking to the trans Golgi network-domain-containing protein n=1 Tax=Protomyces lactucae-debilis TaxID=2754530 RepID=A0A1Y2F6J7_PROLT|nr:integral membrane protein S linking to the trans Golgi network-domain-containing protein [Protomyces lactucae-debilis]ORY79512.1 integral membrane protein S linking to the trans Golgi network-domain-containing protein [Protomyces lactucae-debilis]
MAGHARDPATTLLTLLALLTTHSALLFLSYTCLCLLSRAPIRPLARVWDWRFCSWQIEPYALRFGLAHLAAAAATIPAIGRIVQRSKLVLDFALTTQAFTLLFSWLQTGAFPWSASWWLLWLVTSALLVFGGEWVCMRQELKPMTFGRAEGDEDTAMEVLHEFVEEDEEADEEAQVGLQALQQEGMGASRTSMQGGRRSLQAGRRSLQETTELEMQDMKKAKA